MLWYTGKPRVLWGAGGYIRSIIHPVGWSQRKLPEHTVVWVESWERKEAEEVQHGRMWENKILWGSCLICLGRAWSREEESLVETCKQGSDWEGPHGILISSEFFPECSKEPLKNFKEVFIKFMFLVFCSFLLLFSNIVTFILFPL